MMELWIFSGCPASDTSPRIIVRSAMLLPNSVPMPIPGSPRSADMMLMNPSGKADTSATRMKLVTNPVSLRNLAMCATAFAAYSALLASTTQATMKISTSLYMKLLLYW